MRWIISYATQSAKFFVTWENYITKIQYTLGGLIKTVTLHNSCLIQSMLGWNPWMVKPTAEARFNSITDICLRVYNYSRISDMHIFRAVFKLTLRGFRFAKHARKISVSDAKYFDREIRAGVCVTVQMKRAPGIIFRCNEREKGYRLARGIKRYELSENWTRSIPSCALTGDSIHSRLPFDVYLPPPLSLSLSFILD